MFSTPTYRALQQFISDQSDAYSTDLSESQTRAVSLLIHTTFLIRDGGHYCMPLQAYVIVRTMYIVLVSFEHTLVFRMHFVLHLKHLRPLSITSSLRLI